jgi:hypothetical protein
MSATYWVQLDKRAWSAQSKDGKPLRVKMVGLKEDAAWGAYRAGMYLGEEATLEEAQRRAEAGAAKPRAAPPQPPEPEPPVATGGAARPTRAGAQGGPEKATPQGGPTLSTPAKEKPAPGHPAMGAGASAGAKSRPPGKGPPPKPEKGSWPPPSDTRIIILKEGNTAAAGSKRYAQYDLCKRSETVGDFKKAGGRMDELLLFRWREWIKLET